MNSGHCPAIKFARRAWPQYFLLKFRTLLDVFDTNKCSKYLVLIMFNSGPKLPHARLKDVRVRVRVRVRVENRDLKF